MSKLLLIFILTLITSCSFDNKTGIWQDASDIPIDNRVSKSISEDTSVTRYENIFVKNKIFSEEKEVNNSFNLEMDQPIKIINWLEEYAIPTNNVSNFSYNDQKVLLFKSSKLKSFFANKENLSNKIVFYNNNLISHDHKGTIFIFSLSLNKKIFEYNFYKKSFKKFNKKINFIVNENILYAADNLGYLYGLNLENMSIIWAKNYGIPFRSNLKFENNQLFIANQDNVIYSIAPDTGQQNWQFATSLTFLKSDFKNNFVLDVINNNLFFLNTSGELYSINYLNQKINWVLNFKNSSQASETELFLSYPLVFKNNNLIITTENSILSYDSLSASKNWAFSAQPVFKPIITFNNTYVLLKNNLLICLNNSTGDVVWSKNIIRNIENKKIRNKFNYVVDFKIVNGEINVYSKKGYLLIFNPKNGNLKSSNRLSKNGISSEIFFLDDKMLFVDTKNKLLKFN
jgi:outer membrane protein assembly factor BamB